MIFSAVFFFVFDIEDIRSSEIRYNKMRKFE